MAIVRNLNSCTTRRLKPCVLRHFWVGVSLSVVVALNPDVCCYGQSFLEKLESVVRDKMNAPLPVPPPPKTAKPGPKNDAEELPPPNRTPRSDGPNPLEAAKGSSSRNSTGKLPSILERDKALVPAPRMTEGLPLTPSVPANAVETAEESPGVYLGMEVEELVGGGIGVRVASLNENSPAWKAGFKVGDLLQAVDGHAITDIAGMGERLRHVVPGKPTKFLAKRGGRNLELVAVLQSAAIANRLGVSPVAPTRPAYLGVTTSDLTPAFRTQFGLAVYSGAAITNVAKGSPAYAAGIRPGDAIVEISGVPVDSSDDLKRWMAGAEIGQPAELMVYRGTQPSVMNLVLAGDPSNLSTSERPRSSSIPIFNGQAQLPTQSPAQLPAQLPARTPVTAALQIEVAELRAELENTQQRLQETQKRLEQALQQIEKGQ